MGQIHETKIGARGRGRPTSIESMKIDKQIRNFYLMGASPEFAIHETGLDKNTVYAKYGELSDEISSANAKNFLQKYEEQRAQHIVSIDHLIFKTYKVLTYIEEEIEKYHKNGTEIPELRIQKFSDIAKILLNLKKEKANYSIKLPVDDELKKIIKEMIEDAQQG